jgi:iron-sulfur cluster assembly protein
MYVLDYTDEPPRPRDLVYEFFGTKVYIDEKSVDFVEGSTIVYENTLMFQGLKFKNPLEASTCGCGETFSVKEEVHDRRRKKTLPTSSG